MMYLGMFIAGMVFALYITPLLDSLVEIVTTKKQAYITALAVGINEDQITIQKAQAEAEPSLVNAIGFNIDPSEDDDFPCEDKIRNGRIGF